MISAQLHSGVYQGELRHRRFTPHAHAFSYQVTLFWLNLDEIEQQPWAQPNRRWRWVQWRREDYLGPHALPIKEAVLQQVEAHLGFRPQGAVMQLTHLRYGGLCFNPISLYYCYQPDGTLAALVGEVSNIPWQERQVYVAACDPEQHQHQATLAKRQHVSPFNPMEQTYRWRFNTPQQQLTMQMDNIDPDGSRPFDATLTLHYQGDLKGSIYRYLLRHPWMSLKVIAGIHFEALRLALKKNPIYPHPRKKAKS